MTAPVPLGVGLPRHLADPASVAAFLARAESLGFTSVVVSDWPRTGGRAGLEPVAASAAIAPLTAMRVITTCVLPYRRAGELARQMATTARLSGRHPVLAAALGGDDQMLMRAHGYRSRGQLAAALERAVGEWRAEQDLGAGGELTAAIPVWLAHRARADSSIDRTARIGDGWLAGWVGPARLRRAGDRIRVAAEAAGRDPAAITVACSVGVRIAISREQAVHEMALRRSEEYGHPYDPGLVGHIQAAGPPDACAERLAEFAGAGADLILLSPDCAPSELDEQLERLTPVLAAGIPARTV